MKIFLTGSSGTLGGYIIRELLGAGHQITCFDQVAPRVAGTDFVQGDIANADLLREACQGHEAVIHMAAVPGPGRATPAQMMQVNVVGTINVLEAALNASARKFVFASTAATVGFCFQKRDLVPDYLPLDEEHPCQPHDEYGLSKLMAELACKRYTDAFGMQTICLRVNNNWYLKREEAKLAVGAGWAKSFATVDDLWTKRYRKTILDPDGEWVTPGPPAPHKVLWGFTDARDAAQAFRLAVENTKLQHEVFLVSGDDTCSLMETPALLARYFPSVPLKTSLTGFASLWSHAKATRLLGYQPQYTWRESDFRAWLDQHRD
jgi:nucleoside-diphosphate-sugar epimerase